MVSKNITSITGRKAVLTLALLGSALWMPGELAAQEIQSQAGEGDGDASIIVTARRREERLQDTPLTVRAFTTKDLEARDARSIQDLTKFTPGINFNAGSSRFGSSLFVRGMSQISGFGDNRRDLVTIFIDGVPYIGNPSGVGLHDLSRVEVIKGPQSALFGRATFGGAISLVTNTPGNDFKANASLTFAEYGSIRGTVAAEIPVVRDLLAVGLSGELSTFDGFYENAQGGRLGKSQGAFGVGTLVFTPTDTIKIKARYSQRSDDDGPAASILIARWPQHNCGPFPGFQPRSLAGLPAGFTLEQSRRAYCGPLVAPAEPPSINIQLPAASVGRTGRATHGLTLEHKLATLSADWTFAGHTLNVTASDQRQQAYLLTDFEKAPEDRYQLEGVNEQEQRYLEARITSGGERPFTYMIGGALLDQKYAAGGFFINGTLFGATAGGPASRNLNRSTIANKSIFASAGLDITPRFNVSFEGRYQKDTITNGIGTPSQFQISTTSFLPRAILRWRFIDEANVYFNFARGNQPTQGNSDFFLLTTAGRTAAAAAGINGVVPEAKVDNFEVGLKYASADGRFYANLALYYLQWKGRQNVRTVQADINGDGVINLTGTGANREVFNGVAFGAGDSNTKGIELDVGARLGGLKIGGNLSYADTTIERSLNEAVVFRLFGQLDSAGRQFPGVPTWSGAAYAEYEQPVSSRLRGYARIDATYLGRRWDNIVNLAYVPSQTRVNLRAGVKSEHVDVLFFINNLFDDRTLESANYNSDSAADPFIFQLVSSEAQLARKRQFGVTLNMRY